MKAFVFVAALLCLGMTAHAQCVMTESTIMYIDPYRFAAWLNMSKISRQDGLNLMRRDIAEGSAINVPAGTRLDKVEHSIKGMTIVAIGDEMFIAITPVIKSYCK